MTATFLFYSSLNDFLPASKKNEWITYSFNGKQSVKDAIEALGIPHPEVDIILVNRSAIDFTYRLQGNNRIEVYPIMPDGAFPEAYSLSKKFLEPEKFVLDVHLGKLCKAMRILGIDAALENHYTDKMIAQIAEKETRIVLTRDIGLLKHKSINCGYWLRSQQWEEQLVEVMTRFSLRNKFKPFSRCIICNGLIEAVPKEAVLQQVPPVSRNLFNDYFQCPGCKRIYWKGSHYERMENWVRNLESGHGMQG